MSSKLFSNVVAVSALGISAMLSFNANAATATSNMAITATVAAACTVSTAPLVFPVYTGVDVPGTADLTVTCTNEAPYNIGIGAGAGAAATTSTRSLTNGADSVALSYGIFQELAHTTNWGEVIGDDTLLGAGTGTAQTIAVYALIPGGQTATTVGDYTDTVLVTVNY
ncbi:spore coat protein U domain-containing protein [Pseudomonas agarici]|uniref:Csu type fimbrial protein n=1 Tax=Pseudomonas agarici TaxID=46677 RepID=UPI0004746993|nr:spore coat U domain-containing protein [Pseudomonas agarici]NWC07842.1 spore coat protein U domain-containing protein [Pseudomonas agarici]SEK75860.1 Spore coat protein U (SCPU) domain-containing protein [Pseudomonas agarici]